ncbi:MAG: endonuclease [Planctomycetes bacterium]|nr:endonuclease [Planctomycetota bacterium]
MRHVFLAVAATATAVTAQIPPGYYAGVDASTPTTLRTTLHNAIDGHTKIAYTGSGTDTWTVLEAADQHPTISTQILDIYKNAAYAKQGGGNSFYNREHSWPNSYGFPTDGPTNLPYSDCHHLFLSDIAYNADRGNLRFANGNATWTERTTLVNAGQGGGSGTFPGNSNWFSASGGWQVWGPRRGDIARAMFYMDVRYEGGGSEPDLRLTDTASLIQTTGGNASVAYMGLLSVLLQWHQQDPVDAREIARNNVVYGFQGNRNPFVDHPEWVDCIYLGACVRKRVAEVWINELHYDNSGTDIGEFVEVAGAAGTSLKDWMLLGYDGTTGLYYAITRLAGTIPNQQNGFGTLAFDFPGLQNGSPDGIALVTATGVVMQFVSYEGSFTAVGGAAQGLTSIDIGVSQTGTGAAGLSLQLTGTGDRYGEFTWQAASVAQTKGLVNTGQTLQ